MDVTEERRSLVQTAAHKDENAPNKNILSMKEPPKEYYSLWEIIKQTQAFLHYLGQKWWLLLLLIILGAGMGLFYYSSQKPRYEAVSTFILEEKSGGSSGLSGLASQFGFNLGTLGGGSMFSGDNILEILKSKTVIEQVLISPVTDTLIAGTTLADRYLDFTGIKKRWQEKGLLPSFSFAGAKKQLSPIQDSVLNVVYESIIKQNLSTERMSKQGTIIKVQVAAADAQFARLMTERIVQEASKLYLDLRIGTGQENIRQLQRRSDSLLVLLNNKSYRAAASQPLDINPGIRTAIVPVEIATRDKTVLSTLYAEVTKNLEASRMLLSQQTPVIQLLDRPGYLLNDNKKGLLTVLAVSIFSAGLFFVLVAFPFFLVYRARKAAQTEI